MINKSIHLITSFVKLSMTIIGVLFISSSSGAQTLDDELAELLSSIDSLILDKNKDDYPYIKDLLTTFKAENNFEELSCRSQGEYYYKLGVGHYYLKDYSKALVIWRDSSFIGRPSCSAISVSDFLKNHKLLARLYYRIGNTELREKHLLDAVKLIPLITNSEDISNVAGIYRNLAIFYENRADYDRAREILIKAIAMYDRVPNEFYSNKAIAHRTLAELYVLLGDYSLSIAQSNKAIAIYKKQDSDKFKGGLVISYLNLAQAYLLSSDFSATLDQLDKAFKTMESYRASEWMPYYHDQIKAVVLDSMRDYKNGLALHQKVFTYDLERSKGRFMNADLSQDLINIGANLEAQERIAEAMISYNQAINYLLPLHRPLTDLDVPRIADQAIVNPSYLLVLLHSKARLILKAVESGSMSESDLSSSYNHFLVADTLVHQIRQQLRVDGSKYHLASTYSSLYEDAIDVALELHEVSSQISYLEAAYNFAMSGKSAILLEHIHNAEINDLDEEVTPLVLTQRKLNEELKTLESELFSAKALQVPSQDSLEQAHFDLKNRHDINLQEIERQENDYNIRAATSIPAVSLVELRESLPDSTALIEYFQGRKNVYAFYLDQSGLVVKKWPVQSSDDRAVERFLRSLSDADYIRKRPQEAEADYIDLSVLLYNKLMKPFEGLLTSHHINRLKIAPDGRYSLIPFEALAQKRPDSWVDTEATMLNDFAISYLPSGQWMVNQHNSQNSDLNIFAGFGTEYDDESLDIIHRYQEINSAQDTSRSLRSSHIRGLPFADDEVTQINDIFNGSRWINEEATLDNFLNHTSDARILHIAAHGFVNQQEPRLSALAFHRDTSKPSNLLLLPEIYRLDLSAELVTLSACNSGSGRLEAGEGRISLARGFHAAGAQSVLSGIWSVSDEATTGLMVDFYKNIRSGWPKDQALQRAKLAYIHQTSPAQRIPLYWSPYILSGRTDPIVMDDDWDGRIVIWMGIVLFMIAGYLVYRRIQ